MPPLLNHFSVTLSSSSCSCLLTYTPYQSFLQAFIHSFLFTMSLLGTEWDEIKSITKQVASALRFVHSNGFIHGDIKPSNIIQIGQKIKLIDLDAAANFLKVTAAHLIDVLILFLSIRLTFLLSVCLSLKTLLIYASSIHIHRHIQTHTLCIRQRVMLYLLILSYCNPRRLPLPPITPLPSQPFSFSPSFPHPLSLPYSPCLPHTLSLPYTPFFPHAPFPFTP